MPYISLLINFTHEGAAIQNGTHKANYLRIVINGILISVRYHSAFLLSHKIRQSSEGKIQPVMALILQILPVQETLKGEPTMW